MNKVYLLALLLLSACNVARINLDSKSCINASSIELVGAEASTAGIPVEFQVRFLKKDLSLDTSCQGVLSASVSGEASVNESIKIIDGTGVLTVNDNKIESVIVSIRNFSFPTITLPPNHGITFSLGPPAKLEITGTDLPYISTCAKYRVRLLDAGGNETVSPNPVTVSLSGKGSGEFFQSNSFCSVSTNTVTIAAGESSGEFYYTHPGGAGVPETLIASEGSTPLRNAAFTLSVSATSSGSIDTNYQTTGYSIANAGSGTEEAFVDFYTQPVTGIIYGVGNYKNGADYDILVAKFLSDGTLDPSFGMNGVVTFPIGTQSDFGTEIEVLEDGKILVAGSTYDGANDVPVVARLLPTGELDPSFNGIGYTTVPLTGGGAEGLCLQNDGKIILSSSAWGGSNYDFGLARLNADGSLDTTYGPGGVGYFTSHFGANNNFGIDCKLQSDGKVIVVGYTYNSGRYNFSAARYSTSGFLDTTFDLDGYAIIDFGTPSFSSAIDIQSDGKILLAGISTVSGVRQPAVVRLNPNGSLDTTFNGTGRLVTNLGGTQNHNFKDVRVQHDGKILGVGYYQIGVGNQNPLLVRYNPNGSLDTTLDSDGILITNFGETGNNSFNAVSQTEDGSIMIGGQATFSGALEALIFRFQP